MHTDDYITLNYAAQICPGKPHMSAVWRWCRKGLKSRSGDIVRLQHIRAGGRIYTTQEWLSKFFSAIAESDITHFENKKLAISKRRRKIRKQDKRLNAIHRAEKELKTAGI